MKDAPGRGGSDWNPETLFAALELASEWAAGYRRRIEDYSVFPAAVEPGEVRRLLGDRPPRAPAPFARVLADFENQVVPALTHWNHPGFLAYFSSCARGPSIAAELLIAAVGSNAMLWRTSPGATEVEVTAVDWLRQAVGLPDSFSGIILDTASTSTFTAILAAREQAGDGVRRNGLQGGPALAVYMSDQANSSVEKGVLAAGLGRRGIRHVPVDGAFRMRADALEAAIAADIDADIRPAMICATIGTTSTASADPVEAISAIADKYGIWLHVDAAYAGPAAMIPDQRKLFAGWERADSIVMNPHKWLGTALDCSVLLYRDAEPFRTALALSPAYLESTADDTNLADIGLPLGRRFRGLKLWMLFRCVGTDGLGEALQRNIAMAEDAAERLARGGVFELAAPVSFSTVCFRAPRPDDIEAEKRWNRDIMTRVNEGGRIFISNTELGGRYTLRLAIGSVYTEERHMDEALRSLRQAAARTAPRDSSLRGAARQSAGRTT